MISIVKYSEIHKSIVNRIKVKFPDAVFSTDIDKAISRPSFFIDFDNLRVVDFMREAQDKEITVRIYYFSTTKDGNKIELLDMKDDLIKLFLENNLIKVNEEIKIEIDEIELSTVDKVLHCYFDIKILENYDRYKSSVGSSEIEFDEDGNVIDREVGLMEELELSDLTKE